VESVLVTGASGTVGRALVEAFLNRGDRVVAHARLPLVFGENAPDRLTCIYGDLVSDFESILLPDDVDVLVNCAGISSRGDSFASIDLQDVQRVLAVNFLAPLRLSRKYLPGMLGRGRGRIVNVNSIWGVRGTEDSVPYVVSKHALTGLTRGVAKEIAGSGVTINDVCPAAIESAMMDRIMQEAAVALDRPFDAIKAEWEAEQLASRFITVDEVVNSVLFLASSGASGVNGHSLVVDLGRVS